MIANNAGQAADNSLPDEIDRALGVLGWIEDGHVVEDRLDVTGEAALLRFHFRSDLKLAFLEGDAGVGLGEIVQFYQRNASDLELGVEGRPGGIWIELDLGNQRLRDFFAVGQVRRHHLDAVYLDVDFRFFVKIAVMNFAVVHREAIDPKRKKLANFVRPRFVDPNLAARFAGAVYEIQLRPMKIDLADEGAVE